jgi:hypothetical protein
VTTVALRRGEIAPSRALTERILSALPLVTLYFSFCVLYATFAWLHPAPWLFLDELKYPDLARSIADGGRGTIRGEVQPFENLYVYLLAPVWKIWWDVPTAYAVSKYVGVLVMSSAMFPAFGLARLLVSRRPAFWVAAATVAVPSMFYSSLLAEETIAYPWATLCLYLFARALLDRTRGWIAAAVVAALLAPLIRGQLAVLPVVLVLAGFAVAWQDARLVAWRARWNTWEWAGFGLLVVGAVLFFSEVMGHLSPSWELAVGHYKGRMLDYGLRAVGGFTIGIGILPLVAGIALFGRRPSEEPRPRAHYVFLSLLAACMLTFGFYTAVKAGYLSARFGWPRLLERNLIYLGPLLFVAVAVWFERPRFRGWALAAGAAVAGLALARTPDQSRFSIYSDAPGVSILSATRRHVGLDWGSLRIALFTLLVLSVAVLLLPRLRPGVRAARVAVGVVAVFVLTWNMTGELSSAFASNKFARDFLAVQPDPPNWVDVATGGKPTLYLGQGIADENRIFGLEFWNRSLVGVWTLDSSAPGYFATITPDLKGTRGVLIPQPKGIDYVVAEQGVNVVGDVVARAQTWTLVKVRKPLRLEQAVSGLYNDGWTAATSSYNQFFTRNERRGFVTVSVSRENWKAESKPATVRVRIGPLGLKAEQPVLAKVTDGRTQRITSGKRLRFVLRTPPPPFRVEVSVTPTFSPEDYGYTDQRDLGAQVRFSFTSD